MSVKREDGSPSARAGRGKPLVSLVIPCFNEQDSINLLYDGLAKSLLHRTDVDFELVFIDDGSCDLTGELLQSLAARDERVVVVTLTRNFGHQPAVSAGLQYAQGDAVIVCDADLQDTPEAMMRMIDRWLQGASVVYGVRKGRKESLCIRAAYFLSYRLLRYLSEPKIPADSGDFGLMDRAVVDALNALPERSRFVRGLRSWVGYEQVPLVYERGPRIAGRSKYTLSRLANLALSGIFDFSVKPLTAVFYLGLLTSLISLSGFMFFFLHRIIGFELFGHTPDEVPGFTTIVLGMFLLGSVQLLAIGLLGQYIGRLYEEVKSRPSYLVKAVRRGGSEDGADEAPPS
jgi:glycosyltransferase involved in cell wall biosynthesis